MSQPRRRRRRRRRRGGSSPAAEQSQAGDTRAEQRSEGGPSEPQSRSRRRRRRRGARRSPQSPATLEDIERSIKAPPPEQLTAPPDGQTLEELVGDLQSVWGVPQYPQEFRITLKVAEERSAPSPPARAETENGVQREKAPAAPRMGPDGSAVPKREKAPRRRRGSRRSRRRRSGGS